MQTCPDGSVIDASATCPTPPPPPPSQPSTQTGASNNTGNAASSQQSNNTDLVNTILAIHNRERADVGVPPLVWSDSLAAGAKPWAEHLATTRVLVHSSGAGTDYGENIAGFNPSKGVSAPEEGQLQWVAEKKDYHGGVLTLQNWQPIGHYTQMVWRDTKEVGCATATGGHPCGFLVCRYSPQGNIIGEKPY